MSTMMANGRRRPFSAEFRAQAVRVMLDDEATAGAPTFQGTLRDPQPWNRDAYARNNLLIYTDPDGWEVKPLDELALDRIRSTVPENLRGAIVVGENGMLDKNAMNAVETTDANFLDLRTLANLSHVAEIATANGAADGLFLFVTPADDAAAQRRLGVRDEDVVASGVSYLGYTAATESGARVTLSDGAGSAVAPPVEHAVATAHELYLHALPLLQGRPWRHENGSAPINSARPGIEARTRRLYGQQ